MTESKIGIILHASGAEQVRGQMSLASSSVEQMSNAASAAKGMLIGLASGLTVGAFTAWIKGAIDAADATKEFSERTGVVARDVAGLQLAFQQGGVGADELGSAIGKMSRNMVEGGGAFDKLGIATRNADGSMRSVKSVLYDTADAFASITDGAAKSALAQEMFGRAGAALIPTLNQGADGLREMAEMAERLGLAIDEDVAEAADKFNDTTELLGMGLQGIARQVAAQLLPALNSVAGGMLTAMTQGDALRQVADALGTGLKGLYSIVVTVAQAFNTLGKLIGGGLASIGAAMSGDFKGAIEIARQAREDIAGDWTATIGNLRSVWDGTAAATVESGAKIMRVQRDLKLGTEAQKKATEDAARAEKARAAAAEKYIKEMVAAEAQMDKLRQEWLDEEAKRHLQRLAQWEKEQIAVDQRIEKADDLLKSIERETDMLGMSNTEREVSTALLELERLGLEKGSYAYEVYAEKIRDAIVNREAVRNSIEQTKEIADEWTKLSTGIGDALTDSLFRAFESGGNFFRAMWDGIVNVIKTSVLQPVIRAIAQPITGSLLGMLGLAGPAQAAGGASSLASAGGLLGSLFSGASNFGAGLTFGLQGSGRLLATLGTGANLMGAGSTLGGLGTMAGALGPYALAAYGLYRLWRSMDNSGTPHLGALAAADLAGSGMLGPNGGGLNFAYNGGQAQFGAGVLGTASTVAGLLNALGMGSFSVATGFADDSSTDPAFGALRISRNGMTLADWEAGRAGKWAPRVFSGSGEAGWAEYLAAVATTTQDVLRQVDLPGWARDIADALPDDADLAAVAAAAEAIGNTERALVSMADALAGLGGPFAAISSLSSDARFELANLAGGIDAFLGKVRTYVTEYFSEQEQRAIVARDILSILNEAGIDAATFDERADLRAMMESIDVTTELGREQMAALLNVAGEFAGLADYLFAQGTTLEQLADKAPELAALQAIQTPAETTAVATTRTADEVSALRSEIAALNQTIVAMAQASTTSAQELESLLQRMNDGDALLVRTAP